MVKDKDTKLTLLDILENNEETLEVPEQGTVIVKMPTNRQKLEARREALKIAEGLSPEDILTENARILAIKMIIEPKIALDDYLNAVDAKISTVLDTVHMWYNLRLKAINKARQKQIQDFLDQMKEL